MYKDNEKKMVVVLNSKQNLATLLNAAFHAVAGLSSNLGNTELDLLKYDNRLSCFQAQISRFPNIILSAKNGSQLKRLYLEALEAGISVNPFAHCMLGTSAQEQLKQTADAEDIDIYVVALFGRDTDLKPLTKRFSLFKQ